MAIFLLRIIHFVSKLVKKLEKVSWKKKLNLNDTVNIDGSISISHYDKVTIEDYVHLGDGTTIYAHGGVKIGRGTIFGPNVTIYSANHRFRDAKSIPFDEEVINKRIEIGENCWIGGNVVVVPGTVIGEGCVVGAGTVVSGSIDKCSIVVGNPCKIIGHRNTEDYFRLKSEDRIFLKIRKNMNGQAKLQ